MDSWAREWMRYSGYEWPEIHLDMAQWLASVGEDVLDQIGEPTLAGRRA